MLANSWQQYVIKSENTDSLVQNSQRIGIGPGLEHWSTVSVVDVGQASSYWSQQGNACSRLTRKTQDRWAHCGQR